MPRRAGIALGVLVALAGCKRTEIELGGRPCSASGACADGYVCNPVTQRCGKALPWGCDSGELCPETQTSSTKCPAIGAFIPCSSAATQCEGGCRTCDPDGTWSECSAATCELGKPWSCSSCSDNCLTEVRNAYPICTGSGAGARCGFQGDCYAGAVDLDGVPTNGCECLRTSGGIEICDGEDNDCDGTIDNGSGFECQVGEARTCDAGGGATSGQRLCNSQTCKLGPCAPVWWNTNWRSRVPLTLAWAPASTVTDFPALVVLDATRLDYARAKSGGEDLRFVASDSTTVLPHEIERWDPTGTSYVWLRLPRLATDASALVLLYYENPNATPPTDAAAVWSNGFAGVWHLDESLSGVGATEVYRDSTSHARHGNDGVDSPTEEGLVGGAVSCDGNDLIAVPSTALDTLTQGTLEAVIMPAAGAWRSVRRISLAPATPRGHFQVNVDLGAGFDYVNAKADGSDVRVLDDAGQLVPHWVSYWNIGGSSRLWVNVPTAGTSTLWLVYGNPAAPAGLGNPASVFDFWEGFDNDSIDTSRFSPSNLSYTGAGGVVRINAGGVALVDPLAIDLRTDTIIETAIYTHAAEGGAYGGAMPAVASVPFPSATNGGGAAAVMMMRGLNSDSVRHFVASGSTTGYDLADGAATGWTQANDSWFIASARITANAVYFGNTASATPIASVTGIVWADPLGFLMLGSSSGDTKVQDTSYDWVRIRKSAASPPVASVGGLNEHGLGIPHRFTLTATNGVARASVGGIFHEVALPTNQAHHLALVFDGSMSRLLVDGAGPAAGLAPLMPPATAMPFWVVAPLGSMGVVDEVRISSVVRSQDWLEATSRTLHDTLFAYGEPERLP